MLHVKPGRMIDNDPAATLRRELAAQEFRPTSVAKFSGNLSNSLFFSAT